MTPVYLLVRSGVRLLVRSGVRLLVRTASDRGGGVCATADCRPRVTARAKVEAC